MSIELDELIITRNNISEFLDELNDKKISARSQARIISAIKSFYKYLIMENYLCSNPADLIESPKIGLKLPDTLTLVEIDQLIKAIDLSSKQGERNRAIIETLYSCGLRVSELINLKLSNIYFKEKYLRVIGKGDKERLAPIGGKALKYLHIYINEIRNHQNIQKGNEDFVFLNNRGSKIKKYYLKVCK